MKVDGENLAMTRGDTESITVWVKEDGEFVPLEDGDVITFTMRKKRDAPDIVAQVVVTEFSDGCAVIPIPHELTCDLKAATYAYDVQLVTAEGTYTTIIGGDEKPATLTLHQDVTW